MLLWSWWPRCPLPEPRLTGAGVTTKQFLAGTGVVWIMNRPG
jgi:hypothetical protein